MRLAKASFCVAIAICAVSTWGSDEHHESGHGDSTSEYVKRVAKQSSRDVKVPTALVSEVEKGYREFRVNNKLNQEDRVERKFMDVQVRFRQRRPAALVDNILVRTPLGGGVIDLSDFVTEKRGSFEVQISAHLDQEHEAENMRVYFVSHTKARRIDGEEYGAGCAKVYEISSYFGKKMSSDGISVYTTEQRYVSVLGGTFVMVSYTPEAIHVGSVTFSDPRFPELTCEAST